jgi:hypothetical protein
MLGFNALASSAISAQAESQIFVTATLSVTAVVTPNLTLVNQLVADITATNVTAIIEPIGLDKIVYLLASVDATAISTGNAVLNQPLTADITATNVTATIGPIPLDKIVYLFGALNSSATISGSAVLEQQIAGALLTVASTQASVNVTKNLSASITATAEAYAESIRLVFANVLCTASTIALLDVDGNTEGSPGGIAAPGFSPASSVVLAQHIESAPVATYTITADFDALLETEITSVFFNDNPANVLSYSIIGPDVFITANTPADVYAQASTFMVKREVVPYYNDSFNYNVRFNTVVKRDNAGNNFYSDKFYSDQNAICYLSDDGLGIIDLYEEVTPGNSVKLKSIGKIDYTTGAVEVRGLTITSMYDLQLFFYVESLDSVIPTQDYFNTQNNLLVQSKTITFPSGEKVEISQYEKQTDVVDLEIYVTARSYSLASPLTTVETRTATYVLRIVPDYDIGKVAIQQLIAEQAV